MFALPDPGSLRRRQRVVDGHWGRARGWWVEWNRQRVAVMRFEESVDLFWDAYRLERVAAPVPDALQLLSDAELWRNGVFEFRSIEFGQPVTSAFCDGDTATRGATIPGRVLMRGLYLQAQPLRWWERLVLRMALR